MLTTVIERKQFEDHYGSMHGYETQEVGCDAVMKLLADVEELLVIVNKLPKDAENNPCVPGDVRYHIDETRTGIVNFSDWEDEADLAEGVEFADER